MSQPEARLHLALLIPKDTLATKVSCGTRVASVLLRLALYYTCHPSGIVPQRKKSYPKPEEAFLSCTISYGQNAQYLMRRYVKGTVSSIAGSRKLW